LVRALRAEYAISVYKVVPHRDVKTTLCPGEAFPWEEFQRRIR
jgi:N-acetyl-anhydromuramyl-L-alanine amidase AmpD